MNRYPSPLFCLICLAFVGGILVQGLASSLGATTDLSPKKGVGYFTYDGVHHGLEGSGVSWCYDWGAAPVGKPFYQIEFVPMIHHASCVEPRQLAAAQRSGHVLLAFNEPDATNQANMTVEQALALWPRLQESGMRLGSPAPTPDGALPGKWLDSFVHGIRQKGYRLDFLCVHYYSPRYDDPKAATAELKEYLTRVHEYFGMPIWLTEFALTNWKSPATADQQQAFIKEVVPMLESLPFLERYAWFAMPKFKGDKNALTNSNLIDDSYRLNPTGTAYRDAK